VTFERKVVRGGILLAGAIAIAVAVVALSEQGGRTPTAWAAVASALAVLAALASALGTHKVVELQENALQPTIRVALDFRRRYNLAQLSVTNAGGSPAYNERIEWHNLLHTVDDQEVQIFGPSGVLPVLLARDEATSLLGESHSFLKRFADSTWSGTVSYEDASGDHHVRAFSVTAQHERLALVHNEERPRTEFELQKIPDRLERIAGELENIRRLLEKTVKTSTTDLTDPKDINAVLRVIAETREDSG